jgi:hypothetical protein
VPINKQSIYEQGEEEGDEESKSLTHENSVLSLYDEDE